jgi:hypothetical protein
MGYVEDLRSKYDTVRSDLDEWLSEDVKLQLDRWASGRFAREQFGHVSELDALCLIATWAAQVPWVLATQVQACREQGRSWNEVAAALGVSRQAAKKRFEKLV